MIYCDQFILSFFASNKRSYQFNHLDQASGLIIMFHSVVCAASWWRYFFFAFNLFKYRTKLICLNCKLKFVYPCSLLYSLFLGNWFFSAWAHCCFFYMLLIHSVFSSIQFEKFKRIDKMFVCMFQCRNQSSKWPFSIVN